MGSRKFNKFASLAVGAVVLAGLGGCVMDAPSRGRVVTAPTGIEGNWREAAGLYSASFRGGSFQWTDSNTGALLVQGNYNRLNQSDYRLQLNSVKTGQTKQANCRLAGSTLNCTRDDGQPFQMFRA